MSALTAPPKTPQRQQAPTPVRRRRHGRWITVAAGGAFMLLVAPVLLLLGAANPPCPSAPAPGTVNTPAGGGPVAAGMYAEPLRLEPGRWYRVGATEYGGPADPSSSDYGSIGTPGESYLPAHPDTFAELSVLDHNPANGGTFTFADANALDKLPYLTALRVANNRTQRILYKRDIGYGQGPGQLIDNGQPYRLDVWWMSASALGISKNPIEIQLAPRTGAGATLGQLPAGASSSTTAVNCPAVAGTGIPLPLDPGTQTKILPSGLAAAGQSAPAAVKAMVAAGNRLYGKPYIWGGGHGPSLDALQPGYDCSSAVSYVLHAGGALGPSALVSGDLAHWGLPGPGRYVTVYANNGHAFMYVAGLRFDTSYHGTDTGPNAGQPGPRWRVYPTVPNWATWSVRHPQGL
jgi:cell wall-associated NlpC family hydrolase